MSETMEESAHVSEVPAGRTACPVCWREAGEGLTPFEQLPEELRRLITANAPEGVQAVCPRCVELFSRAHRKQAADSPRAAKCYKLHAGVNLKS